MTRWGTLFLAAGFILILLLRLEVIDPADWFADPPPPELTLSSIESAQQADLPAFQLTTMINRTQGVFHASRAGQIVGRRGLLGSLIENLNASIRLPRTVPIVVRPCGTENAFYDPQAGQIIFCDELFYEQERLFSAYYSDQQHFEHAVLGATTFFLFHEIGHAIIHQLNLPVLGREEDAADQIATYLLAAAGASDHAFHGGEFFHYVAQQRLPGRLFPYWDEHGLNEQRFYNISCWLYGYDDVRYAFLVDRNILPQSRAQRCHGEAAQNQHAMQSLLAAHLKP